MTLLGAGIVSPSRNRFIKYPNPFFDVGRTYFPSSYHELYPWCRYAMSTIAGSAIRRLAVFPITQVYVKASESDVQEKYEDWLRNDMDVMTELEKAGKDYWCYGNAFISPVFPFDKYLVCGNCKAEHPIESTTFRFSNYQFYLKPCPACSMETRARAIEKPQRSVKNLGIQRWNPIDIRVEANTLASKNKSLRYTFRIPLQLKNKIISGDQHTVSTIPGIFIDAVRTGRDVAISSDIMYHMKRTDVSGPWNNNALGVPTTLGVLKEIFLYAVFRKAQEAIALQHVVPLTILYPAPAALDGGISPYQGVNLKDYGNQVLDHIEEWRRDPNHIPFLPLPVGVESIGGQGRSLFLTQEMKNLAEQIVNGMDTPSELVFGGLRYSGSNVSLQVFGNLIRGYVNGLNGMLRFLCDIAKNWGGWPDYDSVGIKKFRMADDLQRTALLFQLNQANKVSDTHLLQEMDIDTDTEQELIKAETREQMEILRERKTEMAKIDAEAATISMVAQTKAQIEAQALMREAGVAPEGAQQGQQAQPQAPTGPENTKQQPQQNDDNRVTQMVSRLQALPESARPGALSQLNIGDPDLAAAVRAKLSASTPTNASGKQLPDVLPPRRDAGSAII